jgi:hypothetical protein
LNVIFYFLISMSLVRLNIINSIHSFISGNSNQSLIYFYLSILFYLTFLWNSRNTKLIKKNSINYYLATFFFFNFFIIAFVLTNFSTILINFNIIEFIKFIKFICIFILLLVFLKNLNHLGLLMVLLTPINIIFKTIFNIFILNFKKNESFIFHLWVFILIFILLLNFNFVIFLENILQKIDLTLNILFNSDSENVWFNQKLTEINSNLIWKKKLIYYHHYYNINSSVVFIDLSLSFAILVYFFIILSIFIYFKKFFFFFF